MTIRVKVEKNLNNGQFKELGRYTIDHCEGIMIPFDQVYETLILLYGRKDLVIHFILNP